VWQSLHDELKDRGFTVLAVAMDQPDAARPWIEAAAPSYPCLVDRDHHVAELYGLVNVPQAVWIDEEGRIVRGPETAGATDGFRRMDRQRFTMPEDAIAERSRVRARYLEALRDWALKGADSAYLPDPAALAAKLAPPDPAIAEAHACFRLGLHLLRQGREDQARAQFERAIRLHPDSWNIWRQSAAKDARGLASGEAFWARVDALGDRPYYAPVDLGEPSGSG
jgi:tetratricopeptide (TPR) repeat protein